MSQSELRREIRSTITLYPPNAFVGKIDRNSKTGILNKNRCTSFNAHACREAGYTFSLSEGGSPHC